MERQRTTIEKYKNFWIGRLLEDGWDAVVLLSGQQGLRTSHPLIFCLGSFEKCRLRKETYDNR